MGEEMNNNEEEKKKSLLVPIIFVIALSLIGIGVFLLLNNKNDSKTNNDENHETPQPTTENVEQFEGIYANGEDKMYIRKESDTEFHYMIGGNFEGSAIVSGDSAREKPKFNENEYFEFKLVSGGIELVYNAPENYEVAVATGVYKKVADYSKDNVYQEAVGDPQYLETGYNGVYKTDEISLYVFQINENEVLVKASNDTDAMFDEKFTKEVNEINGEISYVAKSFFDEEKTASILNIFDNSIEIIVKDDVLDYDADDKKLENNYKFDRKITKEEIIKEFYQNY